MEAFSRVLFALGADIERLLDAPTSSIEAFCRYAERLPMLRSKDDAPIVAFVPRTTHADDLLADRTALLRAVPTLKRSLFVAFLTAATYDGFLDEADAIGDLFDAGGGLFTWGQTDGVIVVIGPDCRIPDLAARVEDLLATCPVSGIVPIESPLPTFGSVATTTEPAPPADSSPFLEMPYAAVAPHDTLSLKRQPSPFPDIAFPPLDSPFRPISTLPPNPRLRKR